MIALFFSYDGWEFLSWVGGEIKNPGRNLPLGLILGISLIIITYLLANIVFLYALPSDVLSRQPALAAAAMTALFSHNAGRWVSLFIGAISFGAASVVVLGGARIYYCMAQDGAFFSSMSKIHPRWKTPTTALMAQCVWVIVLIFSGRYEQLYTCFIFMMTVTYALTVGACSSCGGRSLIGRGPIAAPATLGCPPSTSWSPSPLSSPRCSVGRVNRCWVWGMACLGIPLYFYWRLTPPVPSTSMVEK